jgi:uncharacterized membrane protein
MNLLKASLQRILSLKRRWLGMGIGCALWLLLMIVGFWATLLLVVLAAIGYFVGRIMEENQSWRDVVTKLLAERYGD